MGCCASIAGVEAPEITPEQLAKIADLVFSQLVDMPQSSQLHSVQSYAKNLRSNAKEDLKWSLN